MVLSATIVSSARVRVMRVGACAHAHGVCACMHAPARPPSRPQILQSSLKGNSKISIVCCVTPSSGCVDETINTLKFAARAKRIKHEAIVNEVRACVRACVAPARACLLARVNVLRVLRFRA